MFCIYKNSSNFAVIASTILLVLLFLTTVSAAFAGYDRNPSQSNQVQPTELNDRLDHYGEITHFNRLRTTGLISGWEIRPSPGLSVFRDKLDTGGSGSLTERGGDFVLSTGGTSGGTVALTTKRNGLYQSGQSLISGIGIIIEDTPTNDAVGKWGYFNSENGFGYGVDDTGVFIFYRRGGQDTKVRQSSWNIDRVNGSNDNSINPSGINYQIGDGAIFKIDVVWYGLGDVVFYLNVTDNGNRKKLPVHRLNFTGKTSVDDPNLPLRAILDNNTTNDTLQIRIGGRNIKDGTEQNKRTPSEAFFNFSVDTDQAWVPLCAVRKKKTFNGRINTQRLFFEAGNVLSINESTAYRITSSETTDASFSTPSGWPDDESAAESVCNPGSFTTGGDIPIDYFFAGSGKKSGGSASERERVLLDDRRVIVLWVRDIDNDGTTPVISGDITWTESW